MDVLLIAFYRAEGAGGMAVRRKIEICIHRSKKEKRNHQSLPHS